MIRQKPASKWSILSANISRDCIDPSNEQFHELLAAGFDDWSESNCIIYEMFFYYPNCTIYDLPGIKPAINKGKKIGKLDLPIIGNYPGILFH